MEKIVEIPEGVNVTIEGRDLVVTGPKGELKKDMRGSPVKINFQEGKATVSSASDRRRVKAHAGTWASHMSNMIIGVTQGWEAQLKIVYSHFPMKFSVEGDTVKIGNFLGERKDRIVKVRGDVKVENKKDLVTVTGNDKEEVGQAAAVIEMAAKVRGFDKRVFQDGIHLTVKTAPIQGENN